MHLVLHERGAFFKKLRSHRDFESSSDRQNKTFQLAQSGCQALRAPHHAGLFALGS
jgi:hypothetical protein